MTYEINVTTRKKLIDIYKHKSIKRIKREQTRHKLFCLNVLEYCITNINHKVSFHKYKSFSVARRSNVAD